MLRSVDFRIFSALAAASLGGQACPRTFGAVKKSSSMHPRRWMRSSASRAMRAFPVPPERTALGFMLELICRWLAYVGGDSSGHGKQATHGELVPPDELQALLVVLLRIGNPTELQEFHKALVARRTPPRELRVALSRVVRPAHVRAHTDPGPLVLSHDARFRLLGRDDRDGGEDRRVGEPRAVRVLDADAVLDQHDARRARHERCDRQRVVRHVRERFRRHDNVVELGPAAGGGLDGREDGVRLEVVVAVRVCLELDPVRLDGLELLRHVTDTWAGPWRREP